MFLNPIMLAGVAGAVLPLVLHFLSRARYRKVDWGGMMFLDPSRARRHHGSRLKELSLLLLRMAIVAMLAMALSRPVLGGGAGAAEQTSLVILLDRSGSLDVEENGPPRLESARRAAVEALSTLRPGDEAALVLVPDTLQPLAPPQFTTDLQSLVVRVNDARTNPTQERADIATGLTTAARLLETSRAPNRQIVVVCDRQQVNWRDVNKSFAGTWRSLVSDSNGRMPQFSVIPIGGLDAGNVVIESVQIANPPVVRDVPVDLVVHVHNYDTIPSARLTLAVGLSNPYQIRESIREFDRVPLNLAAAGDATPHFSIKIPGTGQQIIYARITPQSGLQFDDSLDTVVDVVDSIGVLILTGESISERPTSFRSASELIHLALAPMELSGQTKGSDLARVQIAPSDDWPQLDPSKYRVVILANAPRLSSTQVRQLEQYVYAGGGLLVAPGNLVRAEDYNLQLWGGGAGLLPARLDPPTTADGSQSTSLLGLDFNHAVFRFLKDRPEPVPKVTIGRYFPARATEPRATVVGRYASGQPFLVEGSFGRGRTLLVTTSLDADWSTLPQTSAYLPLVQSAVRYLASGSQVDRNLTVGESMVATFTSLVKPWVTFGPFGQGNGAAIEPVPLGDGYEVTSAIVNRPGAYRLRIESPRELRQPIYIFRTSRDESDLTSLTPQQSQTLSQLLGFEWVDSDPQAILSAMTRWRKQRELWPFLVAAVIALGLLELVLERAWIVSAEKEAAP